MVWIWLIAPTRAGKNTKTRDNSYLSVSPQRKKNNPFVFAQLERQWIYREMSVKLETTLRRTFGYVKHTPRCLQDDK